MKESTDVFTITRLDRSEGIYKHNERFVFFTDKIDFDKDIIKPQH